MAVIKEIARALFKQQKKQLGTECRSPAVKPAIVSKRKTGKVKPGPRKKAPGEILIEVASKFSFPSAFNTSSSIRLDSTNDRLTIQATDTTHWFTGSTRHVGNGENNVRVCIDAKKAKAAVGTPNSQFRGITLDKAGANINGIFIPANIRGCPPVPRSVDVTTKDCKSYSIPKLAKAIQFLAKATRKGIGYGNYDKILIDFKSGKLVATDGVRMHLAPMGRSAHKPRYTGRDIVISRDISKIAKILDGNLQVQKDSHVIFGIDIPNCKAEAGYKLIDGDFHRYKDIMVKKFSGQCKVGRPELSRVLKGMKSHDNDYLITVVFKDGQMHIQNAYKPKQAVILQSGRHTGQDFTAGLNQKFLNDAVSGIPDKEVEILLPVEPQMPWTIKGHESGYMAMLMPKKVYVDMADGKLEVELNGQKID